MRQNQKLNEYDDYKGGNMGVIQNTTNTGFAFGFTAGTLLVVKQMKTLQ